MILKWEDSWHRKVHGILPEKMLQDSGALPKGEGDIVREYKAMHEENFLSSWQGKMEEILEQRRMEGSSLHLEAMRNVPIVKW